MNQLTFISCLLVQLTVCSLNLQRLDVAFGAELNQQHTEPPVYKNGDSWTYSALTKYFGGSSSKNMLNGEFEITFRGGRRSIFRLDGNTQLEESNPGALVVMLPTARIINHQSQYFQFPLAVGKKWRTNYYYEPFRQWISPEATITGIESFTTPAGVFSAYRIERTFSFSKSFIDLGEVFQIYVKEIYFYSPRTRSVVNYHYQLDYQSSGDLILDRMIDIELKGHKVSR